MHSLDRFWGKVNKTESCWLWTGAKSRWGYGNFGYNKKTIAAHRLSKALFDGIDPFSIGRKVYACHTCDTRLCVNPDHLFWGSHSQNMTDASNKKRLHWQKNPEVTRGEKNGRSKISEAEAIEILNARLQGIRTVDLSARYGISMVVVQHILNGKLWNHGAAKVFRDKNMHAIKAITKQMSSEACRQNAMRLIAKKRAIQCA